MYMRSATAEERLYLDNKVNKILEMEDPQNAFLEDSEKALGLEKFLHEIGEFNAVGELIESLYHLERSDQIDKQKDEYGKTLQDRLPEDLQTKEVKLIIGNIADSEFKGNNLEDIAELAKLYSYELVEGVTVADLQYRVLEALEALFYNTAIECISESFFAGHVGDTALGDAKRYFERAKKINQQATVLHDEIVKQVAISLRQVRTESDYHDLLCELAGYSFTGSTEERAENGKKHLTFAKQTFNQRITNMEYRTGAIPIFLEKFEPGGGIHALAVEQAIQRILPGFKEETESYRVFAQNIITSVVEMERMRVNYSDPKVKGQMRELAEVFDTAGRDFRKCEKKVGKKPPAIINDILVEIRLKMRASSADGFMPNELDTWLEKIDAIYHLASQFAEELSVTLEERFKTFVNVYSYKSPICEEGPNFLAYSREFDSLSDIANTLARELMKLGNANTEWGRFASLANRIHTDVNAMYEDVEELPSSDDVHNSD